MKLFATILLLLIGTGVVAQATWPVEVLVPELISVRAPADAVAFDIHAHGYPPLEFPARYPGGSLPVQVFVTEQGTWNLNLAISDLVSEDGSVLIPAAQVYYRVNGSVWFQANGFPQTIHIQNGPTGGWLELTVELELELTGAEPAGAYVFATTLSAETENF